MAKGTGTKTCSQTRQRDRQSTCRSGECRAEKCDFRRAFHPSRPFPTAQVIAPGRKFPTAAAGPPTRGTTRGSPPAESACSWRRSEVGTRGARLSHQLPEFSFVAQPRSPLARAVAAADAVVFSSEINCATNPAPR